MENKKIFIGNLNFQATNEDVSNLVCTYGLATEVRVSQKKGCAVVEMSELAEAEEVIKRLHKTEFMGRELMVTYQLSPKKAKEVATKRFEERGKKFPAGKSRDAAEKSLDNNRRKPFVKAEFPVIDERKFTGRKTVGESVPKFKKPFAETRNLRKDKFDQDTLSTSDKSEDGFRKFTPRKPRQNRENFKSFSESGEQSENKTKAKEKPESKFFENSKKQLISEIKPRTQSSKPRKIEGSKAVAKAKASKATGALLRIERKAAAGKAPAIHRKGTVKK